MFFPSRVIEIIKIKVYQLKGLSIITKVLKVSPLALHSLNFLLCSSRIFEKILFGVLYFSDLLAKSTKDLVHICLLYTSPSPRDLSTSRMPSSA